MNPRFLAALAALALLGPHPPALAQAPAASRPVIAVVPLANESGDAAQDAFADGMTDELAAALVAVADLDVVARSSSFRFKQTADAKAIGQALHAGYLVQGSTDRSGGRVRLQVRLVEASNGTVLAAQDLGDELRNIFDLEETSARALHIPATGFEVTYARVGQIAVDRNATGRQVFDVTGAGDTVLSVLALAAAAGAPLPDAAFLGNAAAGVVVSKLGTATVTPQELTGALDDI